ncbi:head-tail connector protein [Rahnella variigena]|uniref:head-tail connector protein n=1 Tax=Rahnella variigena TaxID=574964 RepID=UPI003CF789D6
MSISVTDVVPIEELRQHIEFDGDDRDALITRYAQSALDYCLRWCDDPTWKDAEDVPSPVVTAMLLVFGDMFEHRTSQTEVQLYVNRAAESLMWHCRNWSNTTPTEETS